VTTIVGVASGFGLDDVLLQRQRSIHLWTAPAFRIALSLGTCSFLLLCIAAPYVADAYASTHLRMMLPIMGLAMPIGAFSMVSSVILRASFRFGTLARVGLGELLLTQALTIALALAGLGPLSFAFPIPIAAAVRSAILWRHARPRFCKPRKAQYGRMFSKGGLVFASRLITTGVSQGDYILLGLLTSPAIVGIYFFAFRLAIQPIQILAGNVSSVLFPTLTQLKLEPERQRQAALRACRVLAFTVMPYCFLQAAVAAPVIHIVFGARWNSAIPLIQLLSIGLAFDAVSWLAGALLSARGEFGRALKYSCLFAPIFFVSVTIGAILGAALGVAAAVSLYYLLLAPIYSYLVFRSYGVRGGAIASIYSAPAASAAVAMAVPLVLLALLDLSNRSMVTLIVTPVLGIATYAAILRVIAPTLLHQAVARIRGWTGAGLS
jgi:PST family polysaccharide transporter